MPTYEYRCDACGNEFSRSQKFGDEPVAECPRCGARPRRLVSRPSIVFKGSGWHVNDYRKAGKAAEGVPADGSSSAGSEPKGPATKRPESDAKKDAQKDVKKDVKKEDAPARSDTAENS